MTVLLILGFMMLSLCVFRFSQRLFIIWWSSFGLIRHVVDVYPNISEELLNTPPPPALILHKKRPSNPCYYLILYYGVLHLVLYYFVTVRSRSMFFFYSQHRFCHILFLMLHDFVSLFCIPTLNVNFFIV